MRLKQFSVLEARNKKSYKGDTLHARQELHNLYATFNVNPVILRVESV